MAFFTILVTLLVLLSEVLGYTNLPLTPASSRNTTHPDTERPFSSRTSSSTHHSTTSSTLSTSPETKTSNSTDSTSGTPEPFLLFFQPGTALHVFQSYVAKLPFHGGETLQLGSEWTLRLVYLTNLTQAEVDARKNDTIIDIIIPDGDVPSEAQNAPNMKRADSPTNNPNVWRRDPSTNALNILSKEKDNPHSEDFNSYLFHPSRGFGTTIYNLDYGINLHHSEFQDRGEGVVTDGWVMPNPFTGGDQATEGPDRFKDWSNWDDNIHEYTGHGTATASIAVGKTLGVASRANLMVAKTSNGKSVPGAVPPDALVENVGAKRHTIDFLLQYIIGDVRQKNLQRKAVVLTTITAYWNPNPLLNGDDQYELIWKRFLDDCMKLDIVVVIAMANYGNKWRYRMGEGPVNDPPDRLRIPWAGDCEMPARLASSYPNMITVGGVNANGSLNIKSTPGGGYPKVPITVYAQSRDVRVALNYKNTGTELLDGTSFAAPAIAGLVAYFLGLPDDVTGFANSQSFFQDVVHMVQSNAWQRVPSDELITFPADQLNYDLPSSVNVAFCNVAMGGLPKIKRDPPAVQDTSKTQDSSNDSMTMTLPDLGATDVPVILNGTVQPGFSNLFAAACPTRHNASDTKNAGNTTSPSDCPRLPPSDPAYVSNSFENTTALKQWLIISEWGVSMDWFDAYIGKHNGTSCFNTYTRTNHFSDFHVANMYLTVQDAQSLTKNTNISAVGLSTMNVTGDSNEKRAGTPHEANPQLDLLRPAATQLSMLCRDLNNEYSDHSDGYLHDPSLGKGISVYVLDSGYNSDHEEFKNRPLNNIHPWSAPPLHDNEEGVSEDWESGGSEYATNIYWDEYSWDDEEGYYKGHGNAVASIIGGASIGVAPRADLFIMRWTVPVQDPHTKRYSVPSNPDPAHLSDAMEYIIDDVKQSGIGPPKNKKAVINFSWTIQTTAGPRLDDRGFTRDISLALWENFAKQCKQHEVILVFGTGNWGNYWYVPDSYPPPAQEPTNIDNPRPYSLDFLAPQSLGTDDNELITVGGVESNGTLYFRTTPKIQGNGGAGSISIYALAAGSKQARNARLSEIPGATENTKIGFETRSGTSFAAPVVSGLVAYLLALQNDPTMDTVKNAANFPLAMKQQIVHMGHVLNTKTPLYGPGGAILNFPNTDLNYADDVPRSLLIAYNGAYDGLCIAPPNPTREKRDSSTSASTIQSQTAIENMENVTATASMDANVTTIPMLRNHEFVNAWDEWDMTGCGCLNDPRGVQDGINCSYPHASNLTYESGHLMNPSTSSSPTSAGTTLSTSVMRCPPGNMPVGLGDTSTSATVCTPLPTTF
ncbi:subtilisin-like protein [Viridothelium virens]|uniref:Subtilisin-like protein n=1 Tax=Viridothelium virens TaxID=1048519 RepID=A0A6A6HJ44_VIRVR|nr:subtilisin-like protein [Viridothelium virens]